jgi:hypothetical protein
MLQAEIQEMVAVLEKNERMNDIIGIHLHLFPTGAW